MSELDYISREIVEATIREVAYNPPVKEVIDISMAIAEKETELLKLKGQLAVAKMSMPSTNIKWRDSIRWCLDVDAQNKHYFVKNTASVYRCIAFKHGIDVTSDIRNKIATTLSSLYMEKEFVGRITHYNTLYYGVSTLFNKDENGFYSLLKPEYEDWKGYLVP